MHKKNRQKLRKSKKKIFKKMLIPNSKLSKSSFVNIKLKSIFINTTKIMNLQVKPILNLIQDGATSSLLIMQDLIIMLGSTKKIS